MPFYFKNTEIYMRRSIAFGLIAIVSLAVGCKKVDPTTPSNDRTLLHIMSAVNQDTFNLTFDYFNADDVVINDFVFNRNFPIIGYADMLAAGTPDEFGNGKLYLTASRQHFLDVKPDTTMFPRELLLAKDEKSTICLADSASKIRFLKVKDEFSFATDTTTTVRFINLSNSQPNASIVSAGGALAISNIPFWTTSPFTNFPHGQYDIELRDASGTLLSSVSMWLSGRTAYTFFAVGNTLAYFVN